MRLQPAKDIRRGGCILRACLALQGHDEIVWSVEIHGQQLFSASADKTIRVWDIASKRCERVRIV